MNDLVRRVRDLLRIADGPSPTPEYAQSLVPSLLAALRESADEIDRLKIALDDHYDSAWDKIAVLTKSLGDKGVECDRLRKDRDEVRESRDAWIRARGQLAAELDGAVIVRKAWERAFAERGKQMEQMTAERDDLRKQWQAEQHVVEVLRRDAERLRAKCKRQLRELRRLNKYLGPYWAGFSKGLNMAAETKLRGIMNAAFGHAAVRAAERAAIDAAMKAGEA